ncbi:polysaccharide deacetylase family protein [Patescibacteria group bacterium]|nr:polysaccharide deacetylase family protein [Patescibacteria group bacterium]
MNTKLGFITLYTLITLLIAGGIAYKMLFIRHMYYKSLISKDISLIKNEDYPALWNNITLSEQKKFKDLAYFENFMKNKYSNINMTLKDTDILNTTKKYTLLNVYIKFSTTNSNYSIPTYFNNPFKIAIQNKNHKLESLGQFSLHSPIIRIQNTPAQNIQVPIVMLHRVSPVFPKRSNFHYQYGYLLDYNLTLLQSEFEKQLEYLQVNGFKTITLQTLYNYYYYKTYLPRKPIILSFDDGRLSAYKYAVPLLVKFHDTADFNIITAFLGASKRNYQYMTWYDLKNMIKDGMEIESHTVTHLALGTLPNALMKYQVVVSKNALETRLHVPIQFIAYPAGSPYRNADITKEKILESILNKYDYIGGLLDMDYNRNIQNLKNRFQLYRVRDSGNISLQGFIHMVSSPLS